jgi:hypothetical protein
VTRLGIRTDKGRRVYYEFTTRDGAAMRGKYGPVHGKWAPPAGTSIVILYDPDNPKRSTRYPSPLVALDQTVFGPEARSEAASAHCCVLCDSIRSHLADVQRAIRKREIAPDSPEVP